jgi:hypothetical protein
LAKLFAINGGYIMSTRIYGVGIPEDKDTQIWRYMPLGKFLSLLDKSALFFCRADRLGDPFEGSFPEPNVRKRTKAYKESEWHLAEYYKTHVKFTFVNCWNATRQEVNLWSQYVKGDDGIAILSSLGRLKHCLKYPEDKIYIGKVEYLDYKKDELPHGNATVNPLMPFFFKRSQYEYEHELRAVVQIYRHQKSGEINWDKAPFDKGLYINTDLDTLIDKIYIAPSGHEWLLETVNSITVKYGLNKEVLPSSLNDRPLW